MPLGKGLGQRETAIERASEKAKGDQMRNTCLCVCYCERAAYLHLHYHHFRLCSLLTLLHNILELELSLSEFPFQMQYVCKYIYLCILILAAGRAAPFNTYIHMYVAFF